MQCGELDSSCKNKAKIKPTFCCSQACAGLKKRESKNMSRPSANQSPEPAPHLQRLSSSGKKLTLAEICGTKIHRERAEDQLEKRGRPGHGILGPSMKCGLLKHCAAFLRTAQHVVGGGRLVRQPLGFGIHCTDLAHDGLDLLSDLLLWLVW